MAGKATTPLGHEWHDVDHSKNGVRKTFADVVHVRAYHDAQGAQRAPPSALGGTSLADGKLLRLRMNTIAVGTDNERPLRTAVGWL